MTVLESIRGEFVRYKALAEGAVRQLPDADLAWRPGETGNSIATICWHVAGNLRSRFTDFLTTDGEKPWRHREEEFAARAVSRDDLLAKWNDGWNVLLAALDGLTDDHLARTVTIRGQGFLVHEALHRALAHVAYHVGQIVYIAKSRRGTDWTYLSIPPGGSDAYNQSPRNEKPAAHARSIDTRT
jgi:uncharacterized damage-inducible protein DinB